MENSYTVEWKFCRQPVDGWANTLYNFTIISSSFRASFLIFHLLVLQEAYAQFVKDYYIKKMETPPSSYDREYLKETTPHDSSKVQELRENGKWSNNEMICTF